MILLDTNVVSEQVRPSPVPCVSEWLDAQPLETLFLSAITVAEIRAGIALVHGFSVATRDVSPFVAAGLHVINPWVQN